MNNNDIQSLQIRWAALEKILEEHFQKKLHLEGILFMIGLRELGSGPREFTKEEKVDLMHIAICRILAPSGYFKLLHIDQAGWPHWEEIQPMPKIDLSSQELFLKSHVVDYFSDIYEI